MKTIKISEIQRHFIKCATNMDECIFDYEEDFEEIHGCSPKEMKEEIALLRELIK